MSNMDSRMKQDLDNYITGHYGEDQIPDDDYDDDYDPDDEDNNCPFCGHDPCECDE